MYDTPPTYRSSKRRAADPVALGLEALGWIAGDSGRVERLLDLTGLGPDELRAGATDPTLLAAVLGFLEAHEPDLVACADAIGQAPEELVAAHAELER